jgi:hypothetical protein
MRTIRGETATNLDVVNVKRNLKGTEVDSAHTKALGSIQPSQFMIRRGIGWGDYDGWHWIIFIAKRPGIAINSEIKNPGIAAVNSYSRPSLKTGPDFNDTDTIFSNTHPVGCPWTDRCFHAWPDEATFHHMPINSKPFWSRADQLLPQASGQRA